MGTLLTDPPPLRRRKSSACNAPLTEAPQAALLRVAVGLGGAEREEEEGRRGGGNQEGSIEVEEGAFMWEKRA